jgi:hypothetical protein
MKVKSDDLPLPEDETSFIGPLPFAESDCRPADINAFNLLLKIESRLRKEARDDLRAQKGPRPKKQDRGAGIWGLGGEWIHHRDIARRNETSELVRQENMNKSPKKAVKSMIYSMFWLNIGMDRSRTNELSAAKTGKDALCDQVFTGIYYKAPLAVCFLFSIERLARKNHAF